MLFVHEFDLVPCIFESNDIRATIAAPTLSMIVEFGPKEINQRKNNETENGELYIGDNLSDTEERKQNKIQFRVCLARPAHSDSLTPLTRTHMSVTWSP